MFCVILNTESVSKCGRLDKKGKTQKESSKSSDKTQPTYPFGWNVETLTCFTMFFGFDFHTWTTNFHEDLI